MRNLNVLNDLFVACAQRKLVGINVTTVKTLISCLLCAPTLTNTQTSSEQNLHSHRNRHSKLYTSLIFAHSIRPFEWDFCSFSTIPLHSLCSCSAQHRLYLNSFYARKRRHSGHSPILVFSIVCAGASGTHRKYWTEPKTNTNETKRVTLSSYRLVLLTRWMTETDKLKCKKLGKNIQTEIRDSAHTVQKKKKKLKPTNKMFELKRKKVKCKQMSDDKVDWGSLHALGNGSDRVKVNRISLSDANTVLMVKGEGEGRGAANGDCVTLRTS